MSRPDDIPERVNRLEHQLVEVRQDAAAARVLAGSADRDVSEFRAILRGHTRTLNALRETQVEQGRQLTQLDGKIDAVEGRLDGRMDSLEARMTDGFTTLALGQAQITALLNIAIGRPEDEPETGPG